MHHDRFYTLSASCPDRVGITARVSGFIAQNDGWIVESSFHADAATNRYFMRIEIKADSLPFQLAELRERFRREVAEPLAMSWQINDSAIGKRVVVLVSKQEHCLYDLLARWQARELDIEIPCVISNHDNFKSFVEWHGIPFHHVPVTAANKTAAYAEIQRVFDDARGDTMVLARYMQILSPELCAALSGRIINIHHSFLPSFAGAKPYHQAYARGVKLIGATCHYVTAELDAGPIIEQEVERVQHFHTPADLVRLGRNCERVAIAKGIRFHVHDRTIIDGHRAIVFPD